MDIDLNNLTYTSKVLDDGTIELLVFSNAVCISRRIYQTMNDVNETISRLNLQPV